jgi:predicted AlkP superfamily pyrophosphatase or phosphodiesterase
MHRVVIVVLDGLRRDLICEADTPNLARFAAHHGTSFNNFRSVFPSATRVASATLATGCFPARHELQGNSLALAERGRIVVHDAGLPDFLQYKRRATGRSLGVPTLAERVKDLGSAVIFSNVSPGAAYAHDPDGHGFIYHRAGSFGPGRASVAKHEALVAGPDLADDSAMTRHFTAGVLPERRHPLGVLWLGDPDKTQHAVPLGSPEHRDALRRADRHAGLVMEAVMRRRQCGENILLIVASDHGHHTISGIVDVGAELAGAGFNGNEVVAVSNGTAVLIYVHPDRSALLPGVNDFLPTRDWAERVLPAAELGAVGLAPDHGLAFAVSMASSDALSTFGIPGQSTLARPAAEKPQTIGCGQHGGLGTYEQAPFLMIEGDGFATGVACAAAACHADACAQNGMPDRSAQG